MKKIFLLSTFLVFVLNCKKHENNSSLKENNSENISKEKRVSYSEFLKNINLKNETEKKEFLFHYIDIDVPNYWKGTPWSFAGTSSEPQKGSVACGYFVTNVLANYGFKIKSSYLAQQPSSVMIKQLCEDVKHFSKREDLEKYLLSKDKNQVYIVGLDFHTGFLTREDKDTYFIHSNYIRNQGPVKEKTQESRALNASKSFMVGNLKF